MGRTDVPWNVSSALILGSHKILIPGVYEIQSAGEARLRFAG